MTTESTAGLVRLDDGLGAWGRDDLMALAAVRYCLGRMSYIVGDCCAWLPRVWPHLRPGTQTIIARDIDEAIRRDTEARSRGDEHLPLGMDYDRAEWVRMQHLWKAPNVDLTGACTAGPTRADA